MRQKMERKPLWAKASVKVLMTLALTVCLGGFFAGGLALAGEGYPPEVIKQDVATCHASCAGSLEASFKKKYSAETLGRLKPAYAPKLKAYCDVSCQCTFDAMQGRVPYEQFAAFESEMAVEGAKPSGLVYETLLQCSKECGEGATAELSALRKVFQGQPSLQPSAAPALKP